MVVKNSPSVQTEGLFFIGYFYVSRERHSAVEATERDSLTQKKMGRHGL
jgi:hypothetical protein